MKTDAPVKPANKRIIIVAQKGGGKYNSIQKAINASQPGDTIQVKNGTYSEGQLMISTSCTQVQPCTLMAYPGQHPIIAAGTTVGNRIYISGKWWIIDGFEITGNYEGIKTEKATNLTLRNNWIHGNYGQGILLVTGNDILIENNTIELNGTPDNGISNACGGNPQGCHGIYLSDYYCTGISNITISRNTIRNHPGAGIQSDNSCTNGAQTTNNLFENNIFVNNSWEILLWSHSNNNIVLNNTIIHTSHPSTNTTYYVIFSFYNSSGNIVENNIIYSTMSGSNAYPLITYHSSDTQTFDYNLWRVPSGTAWDWKGTYKTDFNSQYKSTTGYDGNGPAIPTEPQFANLSGGDYHITSTSPARNHGTNNGCPPVDLYNRARPNESICDIGTNEY